MTFNDIPEFFTDDEKETEQQLGENEMSSEFEMDDELEIEDETEEEDNPEIEFDDEQSAIENMSEEITKEDKEKSEEKVEEKPKKEKQTTSKKTEEKEVIYPNWALPLKNQNEVKLRAGSYDYYFKRVETPDGNPTRYFLIFCKYNQEESSYTVRNGLLSSVYVAIDVEGFLEEFTKDLEVKEKCIKEEEFVSSHLIKCQEPIENVDEIEDQTNKTFLALISGVNLNDIKGISYNIHLDVINHYAGKFSFGFNPLIGISIQSKTEEDIEFEDHFSLLKFSEKITHKGDFSDISTQLKTIRENISQVLSILRECDDKDIIENVINEIARRMPGKNQKEGFIEGWEQIDAPSFQNLFMALLYASFKMNKLDIKPSRVIDIRASVEKILRQKVFKK
ncbi:MAG: hypothetical protein ACOCQD_01090 [archaeon]